MIGGDWIICQKKRISRNNTLYLNMCTRQSRFDCQERFDVRKAVNIDEIERTQLHVWKLTFSQRRMCTYTLKKKNQKHKWSTSTKINSLQKVPSQATIKALSSRHIASTTSGESETPNLIETFRYCDAASNKCLKKEKKNQFSCKNFAKIENLLNASRGTTQLRFDAVFGSLCSSKCIVSPFNAFMYHFALLSPP